MRQLLIDAIVTTFLPDGLCSSLDVGRYKHVLDQMRLYEMFGTGQQPKKIKPDAEYILTYPWEKITDRELVGLLQNVARREWIQR